MPEKIIKYRIESAQKDSLRFKNMVLEEMTVNACLLINGMPTEMYEYGDTIETFFMPDQKKHRRRELHTHSSEISFIHILLIEEPASPRPFWTTGI